MQKMIILAGLALILIGSIYPLLKKIGLGHLPGDIYVKRDHISFYFPIVSCLLVSIFLSIFFHLLKK